MSFFSKLGLNTNEQKIFTELYKLGTQPASVIARHLQMERTTVYKILIRMSRKNIVEVSEKDNTKQFTVPNIKVLRHYIQQQKEKYQQLEVEYTDIEKEFQQYEKQQKSYLPKIRIFDNVDGIKNIYNNIIKQLEDQQLISMRFFASNVFDEQIYTKPLMKDIMQSFFKKVKSMKVTIDSFLGNGVMIMEHLTRNSNIDLNSLSFLPAGKASINIIIAGSSLYIIIFKDIPFGIKIDSEDLVYSMHFLLDKLNVK